MLGLLASTSLCADPCVTSATQYNTTPQPPCSPSHSRKSREHFPVSFFMTICYSSFNCCFLSVFVCLVLVCRVVVWAVQSVKSSWTPRKSQSQCRDLGVEPQIPSLPPSHAGRLLCWRFFFGIVCCCVIVAQTESPLSLSPWHSMRSA